MDISGTNEIAPEVADPSQNAAKIFGADIKIPEWLHSLIKFPKKEELSRLANFMLIDIRLIFIIVSVYITIGTAITSAANNEAANDTNGNRTFEVSSRLEHQNLQVSGVSNSILWNCREKSLTKEYYKALYGLLFTAFTLIMLVFIVTRFSVLFANLHQGAANLKRALWRIQLLKYLRKRLKKNKDELDVANKQEELFDWKWFGKQWAKNDHGSTRSGSRSKVPKLHGSRSILIIPFCEALFLILALPFMLTTYDLNPMGCLAGPDEDAIEYNNVTGRVQLQFKQSVLNYQVAALVISIILMIPLAVFALLLPVQYHRITKRIYKNATDETKQHENNAETKQHEN